MGFNPVAIPGQRRLPVCVCDGQPLTVEGLKSSLAGTGSYVLAGSSESLEQATRLAVSVGARIMIVDKAFGAPAVAQWLGRIHEVCPSLAVVVWGASMTESEALRYLKLGAKGVVRKTADIAPSLRSH